MAKNLVIVESPAKAKTIEGYLGKDFVVKSSFGHVRDLSKKDAIDVEYKKHLYYSKMTNSKRSGIELSIDGLFYKLYHYCFKTNGHSKLTRGVGRL